MFGPFVSSIEARLSAYNRVKVLMLVGGSLLIRTKMHHKAAVFLCNNNNNKPLNLPIDVPVLHW